MLKYILLKMNIENLPKTIRLTVPQNLTLNEQLKMFKVGNMVYIRPDAFNFFDDVDRHMRRYFNTWAEVISFKYIYDVYNEFNHDRYILIDHNSSDLLITCKHNDGGEFYWYYKCLISEKQIVPNYNPKSKNIRESLIDNNPYTSIVIIINNSLEYDIIRDILIKKGFDCSYNPKDQIETYPVYIFVDNENKDVSYLLNLSTNNINIEEFINMINSDTEYNNENICTTIFNINDVENIDNIFKYGFTSPSYKPKTKNIRESINENYIDETPLYPLIPKTLTPNEQSIIYNIDDYVYIRPDSYLYFDDIVLKMISFYGKWVKITKIKTVDDEYTYSSASRFIKGDYNLKDLMITCDHNGSEYYWYYKCLVSKKQIEPNYKPKGKNIRENNIFEKYYKTNDDIINGDVLKPNFLIGDVVTLKSLDEIKHSQRFNLTNAQLNFINENLNKKITIVEKYYCPYDKIWWSGFNNFNEFSDYLYFTDDSIKSNYPNYKPKEKNIRLLESKKHDYEYIIIESKNYDDGVDIQKKLYELGFKWNSGDCDNILYVSDYPKLIYEISLSDKTITYSDNIENFNSYSYNILSKAGGKIYTSNDWNELKYLLMGKNLPNYKPKEKNIRLLESNTYDYGGITIIANNSNEIVEIQKKLFELGFTWGSNDPNIRFQNYDKLVFVVNLKSNKIFFCDNYRESENGIINYYNTDGKTYTIGDWNKLKYMFKHKIPEPDYKPKRKIIREGLIIKFDNFLLEKSSLSILGVPNEVMKYIQKDLAIPYDVSWDRLRFKKDIVDIIDNKNQSLILQIGIDSIDVFVTYKEDGDLSYFVDSYILNDDWGGGYDKQPRKNLSKNQLLLMIDLEKLIYSLNGNFSIKRQLHRKLEKKEKSFEHFTEQFKKDFIKNFDLILKRIVGHNFKDAKGEILDKAKRIEKENRMMITGLDNPLSGPNSLTILDEFIYQFEDEYSKYFDERLDIQELSNLFTRDKILTSFMLYVYSGKIITT